MAISTAAIAIAVVAPPITMAPDRRRRPGAMTWPDAGARSRSRP